MEKRNILATIKKNLVYLIVMACLLFQAVAVTPVLADEPQPGDSADIATAPTTTVKLIFIHHSTGENWLSDSNGKLGIALSANNYYVSDTNYGWGPNSIGDRTDIPNWTEWFRGAQTPTYMTALFAESGQHSSYTRTLANPGGANTIIMFKSCFPNSALEGHPTDPPSSSGWLTVGHAKYVYNQLLLYFKAHPEKLFVVITAPPLSDGTYAANARAFNQWLVNSWLTDNSYTLKNVAVFDFYNVLTSNGGNASTNDLGSASGNHHRLWSGIEQHKTDGGSNTLAYPSSDDHPSLAGNRKATGEFVPLLNVFYHRWQDSLVSPTISGNAGAAGVVLSYTDGTIKTAIADDSGNFSFQVSPLWSGKVTPSKTGVPSFSPAYRTYTNLASNSSGQNFVPNILSKFLSVAGADGYIRESSENSGVGGAFNATSATFVIGDNATRSQYRGMLSFNTSDLPNDAVIISAKLKLTLKGIVGANPFNSLGALLIELRKPFFGASPALGLDDFKATPSLSSAGTVSKTPAGTVYTGTLSAAALPLINKTGTTQLRLRFSLDDNNNSLANYLSFYSGNNSNPDIIPMLQVTYRAP